MRKGAKVRVDAGKVSLRNRTEDSAWARRLVELAKMTRGGYRAEFEVPGVSFANKFEELLMQLPESAGDWVTMPMNYVLWLYALGCDEEEGTRLYTGLAHAATLACRARETALSVPKGDMPLSVGSRKVLAAPEKSFRRSDGRTFHRLNMILTALCFAACGKIGKSENARVSEAITAAAPLVGLALPPVTGTAENPHTASVSDINPLTSTMLFTTVPTGTGKLLLMLLLRRAWPMYKITTREISREDFAVNLLTYLNLSIFSDFDQSRRTSLTFSNTYLW